MGRTKAAASVLRAMSCIALPSYEPGGSCTAGLDPPRGGRGGIGALLGHGSRQTDPASYGLSRTDLCTCPLSAAYLEVTTQSHKATMVPRDWRYVGVPIAPWAGWFSIHPKDRLSMKPHQP